MTTPNGVARVPLSLVQPAAWEEAELAAVRAGAFAARGLVVVAFASVGAIAVTAGLLLATVAAPLLGVAAARRLLRPSR